MFRGRTAPSERWFRMASKQGFQDRQARLNSRRMGALRRVLADRVCALRKARGLTQEEAADLAQIDERMWQHLEAGTAKNPTLLTLSDVARALGVTVPELLKRPPRKKTA